MRRRLLIPEVVQTSAMDCGPASLKALLEGFGVSASYGRLREACQTDVDGSSIDRIEETAVQLGLDAEQVMAPADHVLLDEARLLPAMAVVRMPNGATHFVIVWRRHGRWLQLMDPGTGRRWTTCERFISELYIHTQAVPAGAWRDWAATEPFLGALRRRMAAIGIPASESRRLAGTAIADTGWRSLAALDAAVRMVTSLEQGGGVGRGAAAARMVAELAGGNAAECIPEMYWSARQDPSSPENILITGAVLLHARGVRTAARDLSPELSAALSEKPSRPGLELLKMLRADGMAVPAALAAALLLSAGSVVFEALLFRGMFDIGRELTLTSQRLWAAGALLAFLATMLLLEAPLAMGVLHMGRKLECRLRLAFLRKIPLLGDRYFQSRLTSDMAERSHSTHQLRQGPELAVRLMRPVLEMTFTVAGIAWLYPGSASLAILAALLSIGIPFAAQPLLVERDLRVRSHGGALGRFYLDAMLGLTAIRAHGAERSVRREQESLLAEWARAGMGLQKIVTGASGLQFTAGLGLAAWLVMGALGQGGEPAGLLLLVYWALNLPTLGESAAAAAWRYPGQRNAALRLFEPLACGPDDSRVEPAPANRPRHTAPGVAIQMEDVTVRAAGNVILENINLNLAPGSHTAIVGPSGAGKSSLAGLLLGWHRAASGRVLADGETIEGARLDQLRAETAWVDPQVQLWNRSLYDNLRYGAPESSSPLDETLDAADLHSVLRKLPDGLQTSLGEGGALLSGGEGQRVRMGRAMNRSGVRLVILDEPARGLDRDKRRLALDRAREMWKDATLICITHDVGDTRDFERVLVIDHARLVEDGAPAELAASPDSRYRALLDAEHAVRHGLWANRKWRRLRLDGGKLAENELSRESNEMEEATCARI